MNEAMSAERIAMQPIAKAIGQKIALARKAKDFKTQAELATAIGVRESTVNRWESGDRMPRLQHQVRLCQVLGQDHAFLFGFQMPVAA